ncbi:glycosyl hydrolase family 18 protein [Isoptericola sp. NPDC019482]|uniref:glycosyl hydrolase family 18 protein n=1 Tax=Isoptericola sp. NPDC019482 TaxID=3154688 RepID=UPI003490651E
MRHRPSPRCHGALTLAAAAAVVGLTAGGASAAPAPSTPPLPTAASVHDADGVNGFKTPAYFPGWGPQDVGFEVADLQRSGAVEDLTHLNYAFGNVTTDLVCDITDRVDPDEGAIDPETGLPEGHMEGDPLNDYVQLKGAGQAVDGVADGADQALAGNFNQLKKLKAANPGLKVLISLGGWTWSDNFSDAVSSPENRQRLVDSCIDLYLDGNLPVVDDPKHGVKGGDGAAAGIFDGFDIDWEWPVVGGEHPSDHPEADKENFLAFAELLRAELDARTATTGEGYLITGFAPASWAGRTEGGWVDPRLAAVVDFLNIQGYDYVGPWQAGSTGHQGNLHEYPSYADPSQSANWGLAADGLMNAYKNAGYRGDQLVLGLAAYGYGWKGVDDPTPGAPASEGSLPFTYYAQLQDRFAEGGFTEHYDEQAGQSYYFNGDEWWTLDTPRSVTAKAEWLAENGFGGAYLWDIAGDSDRDLSSALVRTFQAATPGPLVDGEGAAPWYPTGVYTTGDVVSHDGVEYAAKWWTRGVAPASVEAKKDPWKVVGEHGDHPVDAEQCAPAFDAGKTYSTGDVVSRAGVNHTAQWWTRGELPGSDVKGSWDAGAPCV